MWAVYDDRLIVLIMRSSNLVLQLLCFKQDLYLHHEICEFCFVMVTLKSIFWLIIRILVYTKFVI